MSIRDLVQTMGSLVQPQNETAPKTKLALEARLRGDKARDERNWHSAIDAYQIYLNDVPNDTAIWVQLGHALKEAGRHEDAEQAYRRALSITPDDADLLLNLGHLMKLLGRKHEASRFYESATQADPSSPAYRELLALGEASRAERAILRARSQNSSGTTYFQIDDLLIYFSGLRTVSGIQRVLIEFIRFALEQPSTPGERYLAFVHTDPLTNKLLDAPKHLMRDLVYYLDEENTDQSIVSEMVSQIRRESTAAVIGDDCCFMMLGAFWGVVNNSTILARLKTAGVSIGVYIYDLIPIDFPEFCDPVLVTDFSQSFVEALCYVDFAFTISEFTARSVSDFMAKHGFPSIPITVIKLAHSLSEANDADNSEKFPDVTASTLLPKSKINFLKNQDFVMYVGTIEARKNHKYLFDIWKLLIAEGIPVPQLVFVGRRGWRVNELFEQLKSTRNLGGKVTVLHDLTDAELAALYRQCRFTVFTSFVEGWGLPLGESLHYGKVCVAASTSSLQEVGGDLVPYVDPLNVRDGYRIIKRLITEPKFLRTLEDNISEKFVVRNWSDVSRQIMASIVDNADRDKSIKKRAFVPILEPRVKLKIADFGPRATNNITPKIRSMRLALSAAWHRAEAFGAWMDGAEGTIHFATSLAPETEIVVFLEFTVPPLSENNGLEIIAPHGVKRSCKLEPNTSFTMRLPVACDQESHVRLVVKLSGNLNYHGNDGRRIGIGLVSIVWVAADDVSGRLKILEQFLFDEQSKTASKNLAQN